MIPGDDVPLRPLPAEEIQARKDLGIAYLAMGLHPDAIQEFQLLRSDPDELVFGTFMMGRCYVRMGDRASDLAPGAGAPTDGPR